MTNLDTDNFMVDPKGRLVPINAVRDVDKLEDQLVEYVMDYANDLHAQISRFKEHCFDDIASFMDAIAEKHGAKKGGRKGNVTLTNYAGTSKVQIAVADRIEFSAELQIAKQLIDECIEDWAADSADQIRALINHAFDVDNAGQVNREALFRLRRLEFDDSRWKQAVEAINNSIRITGGC